MLHWSCRPGKGTRVPDNIATMEHLHDRYDPLRQTSESTQRLVLACFACNSRRGAQRQAEMKAAGILSFREIKKRDTHGFA